MDDVSLNKAAIIERAILRVREVHAGDHQSLDDLTKQESIILNIQRACEAAIDLAMHQVRKHALGIPQDSREAFRLLADSGKLDPELAVALEKMVGFRNVAVHDYQRLSLAIVQAVVERNLDDLARLARWAVEQA